MNQIDEELRIDRREEDASVDTQLKKYAHGKKPQEQPYPRNNRRSDRQDINRTQSYLELDRRSYSEDYYYLELLEDISASAVAAETKLGAHKRCLSANPSPDPPHHSQPYLDK